LRDSGGNLPHPLIRKWRVSFRRWKSLAIFGLNADLRDPGRRHIETNPGRLDSIVFLHTKQFLLSRFHAIERSNAPNQHLNNYIVVDAQSAALAVQ